MSDGQDSVNREEGIIEAPGIASRLISVDYIIREGRVPIADDIPWVGELVYPDYVVDLNANDAYTRTLDEAAELIQEKLADNAVAVALLEKDTWTQDDRLIWESELTELTGIAFSRVGNGNLAQYRNDYYDLFSVERTTSLNDLSIDIENNTETLENDCDTMSITRGIVMRRVEEAIGLSERGSQPDPDTNFKVQGNYYVGYGQFTTFEIADGDYELSLQRKLDMGFTQEMAERSAENHISRLDSAEDMLPKKRYHSFIISEDTGAVYDSTRDTKFVINHNQNAIDDFKNGRPLISENTGGIGYDSTGEGFSYQHYQAVINNFPDRTKNFPSSKYELYQEGTQILRERKLQQETAVDHGFEPTSEELAEADAMAEKFNEQLESLSQEEIPSSETTLTISGLDHS